MFSSESDINADLFHPMIIDYMLALGHDVDHEGVCFGIGGAGMHAVYSKNIKSFNDFLNQLYPAWVKARKEAYDECFNTEITDVDDTFKFIDEKSKKIFMQKLKEKLFLQLNQLNTTTAENLQFANYLQKFFGIIHLCTNPEQTIIKNQPTIYSYEDLFPLMEPISIDTTKNQLHFLHLDSRFFSNKAELFNYLASLKNILITKSITQPILFTLINKDHAINLFYDPNHKNWILIDGDKLPIKHYKTEKVCEKILEGFSPNNAVEAATFSIGIQAMETDKNIMQAILNDWLSSETYQTNLNEKIKIYSQTVDANGATWFAVAVRMGDVKNAERLLKSNIDINQPITWMEQHQTPLALAAEHGQNEMLNLLLKWGAKEIPTLSSALVAAIKKNKLTCVNTLLENGIDPNETSEDVPPLHQAVLYNRFEILNLLLQYGANPNSKLPDGNTILHRAIMEKNMHIFDFLLSIKELNINSMNNFGVTPLFEAITHQQLEMVDKLLTKKIDINEQYKIDIEYVIYLPTTEQDKLRTLFKLDKENADLDTLKISALHLAIMMNDDKMVKLLLQKGAIPAMITQPKISCIELARTIGNKKINHLLQHYFFKNRQESSNPAFFQASEKRKSKEEKVIQKASFKKPKKR